MIKLPKPPVRKIEFNPTPKQAIAWQYLFDEITTEIGYGGAARGGKSWLLVTYFIIMCIAYPETRWALGRKELKRLKMTTLVTFFKAAKHYGLHREIDWRYNQQDGVIYFTNGSEILLLDMAYSPQDPLYLRFGGLEITGAGIEESNEVPYAAIDIIQSRVGNWNNDKYGIKPITFETFNPDKGHVYRRFYKPHKEKILPKHIKFIAALPTDNPHIPQSYIEKLKQRDKVTRERLLHGNFEYDADDTKIFDYEAILDLFSNNFVPGGERYLTCDVATSGKDYMTIYIWDGLRVEKIYYEDKTDPKKLQKTIEDFAYQYKIPRSHIIYDNDGVGNYLGSYIEGCVPFRAGSKPENGENFRNLRSQCYFKLAELVNDRKIFIDTRDNTVKDFIIQELEQIKELDMDKDEKPKQVISKDKIKEELGRSPDFADNLMFRMYAELVKTPKPKARSG